MRAIPMGSPLSARCTARAKNEDVASESIEVITFRKEIDICITK